MGFIQKGVSMEQLNETGQKVAILCAVAEKLFKENELDDFLRFINLNESIPMATKEFQKTIELGPIATKRVRAIGKFIKASKETWGEGSKFLDIPGPMLANHLQVIFIQMRMEEGDEESGQADS